MDDNLEQSINRLCNRCMARVLNILEQNNIDDSIKAATRKAILVLKDDLQSERTGKQKHEQSKN